MDSRNNKIIPVRNEENKTNMTDTSFLHDIDAKKKETSSQKSLLVDNETIDNEAMQKDGRCAIREMQTSIVNVQTEDPLSQDTSMVHGKMNATTDILPTENSKPLDEPISVKTVTETLDGFEKIGDEWKIIEFISNLCRINYNVWVFFAKKIPRLIYEMWSLTCLGGYLIFYIMFLTANKANSKSVPFIIDALLIFLDIVYCLCLIEEIYYTCHEKDAPDCFLTFYAWVQCMYCGISIFLFISLLFENNILMGFLFAAAVYSTTIVQSLNGTIWVAITPFLLLGFISEFIVRSVVCKLNCPYMRPKMRTYKFGLFKYGQHVVKEAKQCTICLADYEENDCEIVVLNCGTRHVFHEKCLLEWIKKQEYCPICRGEIKFVTS